MASRPHAPPLPGFTTSSSSTCFPPPPPTPPSVGGNSPLCRHAGCSNAVSASCPVRFCQCTSPRCNVHWPETRQGRQCRMRGCHCHLFRALHQFAMHALRRQPVCSSPNCSSLPSLSCVVRSCAAHCSTVFSRASRSSTSSLGPPRSHSLRICRVPSCNERAHPVQHIPATRRVADPRPPPNPLISTSFARRLWLSDHSVQDGFHMLVNLLMDENVEVLCVQEVFAGDFRASRRTNLSLVMVPPVLAGAKRVSCQKWCVRFRHSWHRGCIVLALSSGDNSVCICSFYAPHAGLLEGERVAFWQELLQACPCHVFPVEYTFIQTRFHPNTISSNDTVILNTFIQFWTLSSNDTLIRKKAHVSF